MQIVWTSHMYWHLSILKSSLCKWQKHDLLIHKPSAAMQILCNICKRHMEINPDKAGRGKDTSVRATMLLQDSMVNPPPCSSGVGWGEGGWGVCVVGGGGKNEHGNRSQHLYLPCYLTTWWLIIMQETLDTYIINYQQHGLAWELSGLKPK